MRVINSQSIRWLAWAGNCMSAMPTVSLADHSSGRQQMVATEGYVWHAAVAAHSIEKSVVALQQLLAEVW